MTKEAQRIAFAKALGWHGVENSGLLNFPWSGYPPVDYIIGQKRQLPDCDDLNVVASARKTLPPDERSIFVAILHSSVKTTNQVLTNENWFNAIDAGADKQTEAFLRTKGLWVEEMVEASAGK